MFMYTTILSTGMLLSAGPYDGWSIANVHIESPSQLEMLQEHGARSLACFDRGGVTPMLIDDALVKFATNSQIEFEIIESDIANHIKRFDRQRAVARERGIGGWYSDYKTWTEVNSRLQTLAGIAPSIATTFIVGTTHEGRSMHGIRITAPGGQIF